MSKIKQIVFYHHHVNGDCYLSRIIVKAVTEYMKSKYYDILFYYNAYRAFDSFSTDLDIPREHFNIANLPLNSENLKHLLVEDTLYINVWIGFAREIICVFCLKNITEYYNEFIVELNTVYGFTIKTIDTCTNNKIFPYISINYDYYNCNFLDDFISNRLSKYDKIIMIYNIKPTTFIRLRNILFDEYLFILSRKYPKFLFITFIKLDKLIIPNNIISLEEIYQECELPFPNSCAVEFSYISKYADKIITLSSGVCQFSFNNFTINTENKIMMIYDKLSIGNPAQCQFCNNYEDNNNLLCSKVFGLHVRTCEYTYNIQLLCDNIENFLMSTLSETMKI